MTDIDHAFAPLQRSEVLPGSSETVGSWKPISPVPDEVPPLARTTIDRFAPGKGCFAAGWRYLDAAGRLLCCIVRYDHGGGGASSEKEFRPFTFCEGFDGRREWRCKALPAPRPLYGLDRLAARPDAPVLIVEGEKTADAGDKHFSDYVVVTSPGGSNGAHTADWSALTGRSVVIWPDADEAGADYAAVVSEMLRRVPEVRSRVVEVPQSFSTGWDLADELPEGVSNGDLASMLASASPSIEEAPLPLIPPLPPAERYPIDQLGPVLSRAAAAVARKVQVPEAIAAQSVLAAAALAAQAHADVRLPFGQTRPLSLFLITVAASGERKSTADNEALWPVRKREKVMKEIYDRDYQSWRVNHAAWSAEKKKIEGKANLDLEGRRAALRGLGEEPPAPLHPFLTAPDPTVEGLAKAWVSAPASLGVFTAEGGLFIGGHGMSQDNRLKTAATYSSLWDGQAVRRIRASDGVTILMGRRLSIHLMVQPEASAQFLADAVLRDQGFLSRVLVAAPDSIAGSRLYRDTAPEDDLAIKAYGARLLSILEATWPLAEGKRNELEPRVLTLSAEAAAAWRRFYDHVESQCGRDRGLATIQDLAAKAAEHAALIAGVLTIVENINAVEVHVSAMGSALLLTDWYVNEALRLQRDARTDPRLLRAQRLLEWLQRRESDTVTLREILQFGPSPLRTKSVAEEAIAILVSHGWIVDAPGTPKRIRLVATGYAA